MLAHRQFNEGKTEITICEKHIAELNKTCQTQQMYPAEFKGI